MDCAACQTPAKRFGKDRNGNQRYRCRACRKGGMRLPVERALLVLHLLCEGSSIRAIERITGAEKKPILRLLSQVGAGCERMLAEPAGPGRSPTSWRRQHANTPLAPEPFDSPAPTAYTLTARVGP